MHSESHLTRICGRLGFPRPPNNNLGVVSASRVRLRRRDAPLLIYSGHGGEWSAAKRSTYATNCRLTAFNHETAVSTEIPAEVGSYLTPKEVAARFRVQRRTIERMVAAKRFPQPLHVGRCVRFPVGVVEAYEKSGGVWPPKASP